MGRSDYAGGFSDTAKHQMGLEAVRAVFTGQKHAVKSPALSSHSGRPGQSGHCWWLSATTWMGLEAIVAVLPYRKYDYGLPYHCSHRLAHIHSGPHSLHAIRLPPKFLTLHAYIQDSVVRDGCIISFTTSSSTHCLLYCLANFDLCMHTFRTVTSGHYRIVARTFLTLHVYIQSRLQGIEMISVVKHGGSISSVCTARAFDC